MKKQKQLFRHKLEEGVIGDCWRTCFACLLNLRPEEVPHFCDGVRWNDAVASRKMAHEWLATRDLSMVEYALNCSLEEALAHGAYAGPGLHYLLGGNSRTGCGHSVVCCGDKIVWDTSLDDAGIVGPMDDGYYWITWLVPLSLLRGEETAA